MLTETLSLRKDVAPAENWKNTLRNGEREKQRGRDAILLPLPSILLPDSLIIQTHLKSVSKGAREMEFAEEG